MDKAIILEVTPLPFDPDHYVQALPVLVGVYGSLRKGMGNHEWLLADRHHADTLRVQGIALTMTSYDAYFPFAYLGEDIGNEDASTVLELYEVNAYDLQSLDGLEGHPDWYTRTRVRAQVEGGRVIEFHTYIMGINNNGERPMIEVPDGDWVAYRSAA